jgi:predicted ATPase
MIKQNFYVITGGPGGGKTSLLNFLASKGYDYVPETAREIIKQRLSHGLPPRPDPATFAQQMFFKDFDNYISNSNTTSLLFFDRSFIDSANLLYNSDPDTYNKIKNTHLINRYNQKVFITPHGKKYIVTTLKETKPSSSQLKSIIGSSTGMQNINTIP